MRRQWIPGSSFRPHNEPGYEAIRALRVSVLYSDSMLYSLYEQAVKVGEELGVVPSVPRTTTSSSMSSQQSRA